MRKQRIIVSVSNDLVTDNRVRKICTFLQEEKGLEVILVGRKLKDSLSIPQQWSFGTRRFRLLFNKGPLFYAGLNMRLFFYLLFARYDYLLANDLDTLWPNYLASKFRKKPLIYDTHEYFTEMPELTSRPKVQRFWKRIEDRFFPKLEHIYTVNDSIKKLYKEEYDKEIGVVRNISERWNPTAIPSKKELGMPEDKAILILQGSGINIDRGGEELIHAMASIENAHLLVIGTGTAIPQLKNMVQELEIVSKVEFKGRMPYETMMQYTYHADIGYSLDKPTNLNYRYSLPNKLFDYLHTGTAVVVSDLVRSRKLLKSMNLG